jgi:predicted glycosyltransferase
VHFFKHFIRVMRQQGHEILITASDKDLALHLLDHLGLDYVNLRSYGRSLLEMIISLPIMDVRLWQTARRFRPDLLLGVASVRAAHAAAALRVPCINFDDSEHARWEVKLYLPFVDQVCTPQCYRTDLGRKHHHYDGFQELAYLHPRWFQPDRTVLEQAGLEPDERFTVVRFISWSAVHDRGHCGFTPAEKRRLVTALAERGRVFVASEAPPEPEFAMYSLPVPAQRIHDLLHFAALYVGEGATMATEAGLLGTPAVYASSQVGTMGNFDELADRWDLVHSHRRGEEALADALALADRPEAKDEWQRKSETLMAEKIDVTQWMIDLVLEYDAKSGRTTNAR